MGTKWSMKGVLLGACSCDWGCPCSFNARPTKGFCEGAYVWHVQRGRFSGTILDGLTLGLFGHSPGPVHEGNLTTQILIDEKAGPAERQALVALGHGKAGGPWAIFASVTAKWLDPLFLPFDIRVDGLNSRVRVGNTAEMALGPILNPVTNIPEEIYLDKPTGFTAKRTALGRSLTFRFAGGLRYDHSGQYGEFSEFEYSGEA